MGEGCTCQGGVPAQGEQISTCEGLDQDHCGRGGWTWALYRWSGEGLGEGGRTLQSSSLPPPPVNRITENITFPPTCLVQGENSTAKKRLETFCDVSDSQHGRAVNLIKLVRQLR